MAFQTEHTVIASKLYTSTLIANLSNGERLRVLAPQGDELMDEKVPNNKKWAVIVRVEAYETEA